MIIILITNKIILIVTHTCNYKPYSHLGQVAKHKQSHKTPHGMYSQTSSRISLVTTKIFHPWTS